MPCSGDVAVFAMADPAALARAAAERVADAAARAVAARGRFDVALAGGNTPRAAYEALATELRDAVPWHATHVYFGDERAVPPNDSASNYGMARDALLDRVPLDAARVRRVRGEVDPAEGAREYDALLRETYGEPGAPTFDLVLLGVGDDGHTASLFPGSPALDVADRWAVAAESPDPARPWPRVTLTFPALCGAAEVLVLAGGAGKARVVRAVARGGAAAEAFPAARVRGRTRTVWLADVAP